MTGGGGGEGEGSEAARPVGAAAGPRMIGVPEVELEELRVPSGAYLARS